MDYQSLYKHEEYNDKKQYKTWIGDYYVQDYGLVFSYSSLTDIQFSSTTYRVLSKFNNTEINLSFLKDDQRYKSAKYHMPSYYHKLKYALKHSSIPIIISS